MMALPDFLQAFRDYLIIDNYAGGGGASKGFEVALGRSVDKAINHNYEAIAMHKMNHPKADHYCESAWDVDPVEICDGKPVVAAWYSPDCKHFSKAKGGAPIDKEIRGLAWVKLRWMSKKRPIVNFLENVEEFLKWGPVDRDGKCIAGREGETFNGFVKAITTGLKPNHPSWREAIQALGIEFDMKEKLKLFRGCGYELDWKVLNACNYGAATSRARIFLVSRADGKRVLWPEATHGHFSTEAVKNGDLRPWKTASEIFDFSKSCKSIFSRKKPLAENTLKRIVRCIEEFFINDANPFFIPSDKVNEFNSDGNALHVVGKTKSGEFLRDISYTNKSGTRAVSKLLSQISGTPLTPESSSVNLLTGNPDFIVGSCLLKLRNNNYGTSLFEPVPTITAGGLQLGEVRIKLVKVSQSEDVLAVGEVMVKGQRYAIIDIAMRMLSPSELFDAQSFGDDFIHDHTADNPKLPILSQARMCGNSVPPELAAAIIKINMSTVSLDDKIAA
jgi:DNA (cytosine-5)-methyltransferase 1